MESSLFTTIISAIVGGSLGAFFLHMANKRYKRIELTLDVLKETELLIEDIEESYSILKYHLHTDGTVYVSQEEQGSEDSKQKFDAVVTVGDFLNKVALLYLYWKINCHLVKKSNLYNILNTFCHLLEKKKFKIQSYNLESVMQSTDWTFTDWEKGWPFLKDYIQNRDSSFMRNKKYRCKRLMELFL